VKGKNKTSRDKTEKRVVKQSRARGQHQCSKNGSSSKGQASCTNHFGGGPRRRPLIGRPWRRLDASAPPSLSLSRLRHRYFWPGHGVSRLLLHPLKIFTTVHGCSAERSHQATLPGPRFADIRNLVLAWTRFLSIPTTEVMPPTPL
jgi:hypothetical protein